jgi:Zn-dependent peptidase ImmA (M78 family)
MTPEAWAAYCLTRIGWTSPVPPSPNQLARSLGVYVFGKPDGPPDWDGSSSIEDNVWWVVLNRQKPWTRRQWTLTHELGHILQHGHLLRGHWHRIPSEARIRLEREADRFARAFLMPPELMWWAAHHFSTAEALAAYLRLSLPAVVRRMQELGIRLAGPHAIG